MVSNWKNFKIPARYRVDDIVSARVTEIHHFGAFLEIEPRVFALALIPEISWSRIRHPGDVLTVGQKVSGRILLLDRVGNHISVSLKTCEPPNVEPDTVRELLKREPFVPLHFHMRDGSVLNVLEARRVFLPPKWSQLLVTDSNPERFDFVPLSKIEKITMDEPKTLSQKPRKRKE